MKYLIFVSTIFLLVNSCIKEECQIPDGYEFEIPATLTPAMDTFQIGDTITIVSSFADELYERKTDKKYKLENFRFYPALRIREISDLSTNEAGILDFEVIIDSTMNFYRIDYSTGAIGYTGEYDYSNKRYDLGFMLIPKKSGVYYFSYFTELIGVGFGSDQDFAGKCSHVGVGGAVKMNDGTGNNIEMLSDSPDPHYNNWILIKPQERFHNFGGYCFYVKE